jgi:hypothetical protein
MNKRIKQLAEQAGCSIDGMSYGEGNVEKFAQLIVAECARVAAGAAFWGKDTDAVRNAVMHTFDTTAMQEFSDDIHRAFKNGADLSNRDTP